MSIITKSDRGRPIVSIKTNNTDVFIYKVMDAYNGVVIMISILAIIIAICIGYNFFNVWERNNQIELLTKNYEKSIDDITQKISALQYQSIRNELYYQLMGKDSEISDNYRTHRWLKALQGEFEIVYFICQNYNYFKDEFRAKIGFKRSSIANILLELSTNFETTDFMHIKQGDINLNDIHSSVIAQGTLILRSEKYKLIQEYEENAYKELHQIAIEFIKQIISGKNQLDVPHSIIEKLRYYKTKF